MNAKIQCQIEEQFGDFLLVSSSPLDFEGKTRIRHTIKRPNGKLLYFAIEYENEAARLVDGRGWA